MFLEYGFHIFLVVCLVFHLFLAIVWKSDTLLNISIKGFLYMLVGFGYSLMATHSTLFVLFN